MATDVGRSQNPAGLVQVFDGSADTETDLDVIAIHGLDTRSPDTWTWRDRGQSSGPVNWLQDSAMLPSIVGRARIFTCDWPAQMLQKSIPTTLEESAEFLLQTMNHHLEQNTQAGKDRPVFFIASCLGGIILIKALQLSDSPPLVTATRGIVFLATPFLGTAFKDIPYLSLKAWGSFNDQSVSALMDYTREPTPGLDELVCGFLDLQKDKHYHVFAFWESHETSLLGKIHLAWLFSCRAFLVCRIFLVSSLIFYPFSPLPLIFCLWLSGFRFCGPRQLVNESSARAQILERQRLNRSHVLMNKFRDPGCADYKQVASKIEEIVRKIREGTLLKQADAWICDGYYTTERLKISRLSGELVPLDRCYVNLTILQQSGQDAGRSREGTTTTSPFSLLARQKVEIPDKTMQIELASIFKQRKGPGDRMVEPRRILIRGRAGVGKTTLCKKIVYEFSRGAWSEWTQLFDRILWVPLRNLKLEGRRGPVYDFTLLFHHEYFGSRLDLAEELSRALETKNNRTLFLLDGLDEVSQDLTGDGSMSRFLKELLKQPNVIITSRPSANTPPHLDLELETIGFHPDQVEAYVERAFTTPGTGKVDLNRTKEVLSFLKGHWLIEGLVRIPIQLDALCYTWDDFDPESVPNTMTGMYEAIEQKLWKKDVVRLQKMSEYQARGARPAEVQRTVGNELRVLECLAFNGMHSGVLDFTPAHRDDIVDIFPPLALPLDETLAQLSFLRTSDSSTKLKDREYHFIHLTFQEYFAARYFVRQWKEDKQLEYRFKPQKYAAPTDPVSFLRAHKYIARYDVLWRFVAGLLNSEKDDETLRFFNILEEPPLDLLGPAHQRLVMHCLGEVSGDLEIRERLETRLSEWLLFECQFTGETKLATELEFPETALSIAFDKGPYFTAMILRSLERRVIIPSGILAFIAAQFEHKDGNVGLAAIEALGAQSALPTEMVTAIAARLERKHGGVQSAAIKALRAQSALPTEIVTAITARLEDEDGGVRRAAIEALRSQSALPTETVTAITARLEDEDSHVRRVAVSTLGAQSDEDRHVRWAAIEALGAQSVLPTETVTAIAARLEHEDEYVQRTASRLLRSHATHYYGLVSGPSAHFLYRSVLRESFHEQQSWYVIDKYFHVSSGEQTTNTGIHQESIDFKVMISKVQPPNMPDLLASLQLCSN
ncbi:hypothetical protein Micbo1qcDRAFT_154579 [Microdochium bolleyi]|uniref:NACHT domain-containing protein n=1 Tax=Microdochium bolleyi TaxID=196109 RepID=A0A136IIY6_9PEZI|nr:hypothetical protein Micbo1qcDRAFT_154579 [Microdochium bolleyi]